MRVSIMDEYKTERSSFNAGDFLDWQEMGTLEITPKFQRRSVWKTPARSSFIDTMLRGMTVPPLYFRVRQNDKKTRMIKEVVDGQQRVRSVLDFIAGGYRLSKTLAKALDAPWAGRKFSELPEDQQARIMSFSFAAEMFQGISDSQILEVFCRLNMNGVGLNKQELRNGKYFGAFKATSYRLAYAYLEMWRKHKIFTEQNIARMLEVELTSELLIASHEGMQDKKKSIDTYYRDWEADYPDHERDEKRFTETMNVVSETFTGDELKDSDFSRPPLFYTLYCVVSHHMFGLPGIRRNSPHKHLTQVQRADLKAAVGLLSEKIAEASDPDVLTPLKYKQFIEACQRQTDNIQPRRVRFDTLYDAAF